MLKTAKSWLTVFVVCSSISPSQECDMPEYATFQTWLLTSVEVTGICRKKSKFESLKIDLALLLHSINKAVYFWKLKTLNVG